MIPTHFLAFVFCLHGVKYLHDCRKYIFIYLYESDSLTRHDKDKTKLNIYLIQDYHPWHQVKEPSQVTSAAVVIVEIFFIILLQKHTSPNHPDNKFNPLLSYLVPPHSSKCS